MFSFRKKPSVLVPSRPDQGAAAQRSGPAARPIASPQGVVVPIDAVAAGRATAGSVASGASSSHGPRADRSEVAPGEPALLSRLPAYRAEMKSLCFKREDQVIALELGYNTVALICLSEFAKTHAYRSIVESLKPRALGLAQEISVTPEQFASIRQQLDEQAELTLRLEQPDDRRNVHLYADLIQGAYLLGATDVHFTYRGDQEPAHVRLRLFGRMRNWKSFDGVFIRQALAAAYSAMAIKGTNSESDWSASKPCSAITGHDLRDRSGRMRRVSGRFTSRQAVGGACKVSVRLLDTDVRDVRIPSLQELGYAQSHIHEQLYPALRKNQGLILIAGGTGSGKSTTLRTFMDALPDKESLERYSVEDPVEYILPGVVQLSIQRASDASEASTRLNFSSALRDLMRMDPDAVMIGEIRDAETAQLACELVNTGHRLLSTVHGNGVIDVFDRLTGKSLAVTPVTLSSGSFLLACMYQKLLPLLCSHCKRPAQGLLTQSQQRGLARFGIDAGSMHVANPEGCPECRLPGIEPTGTRGLTVVAEVVTPDSTLLNHIRNQDWRRAKQHWRSSRRSQFGDPDMQGKTAFEHGIYKMAQGLIDINDLEADFEPLETYELYVPAALSDEREAQPQDQPQELQ